MICYTIIKINNNVKITMDISKLAKELGRRGGKASVKKRFAGKTKEEISEEMRKVRLKGVERNLK